MCRTPARRKCLCCKEFFHPDNRNGYHQRYCSQPDCRRASKAASQRRWLAKPANRNHFRDQENIRRVQQWRLDHPGYWKKKPTVPDQSQTIAAQPLAPSSLLVTQSQPSLALQDVCLTRLPVFIGLVSMVTGGTLQEDIAATTLKLEARGRDILGLSTPSSSPIAYDHQTSHSTGAPPPGATDL